ncbi:MAG: type II toxin-antitoxin system RelE/ParE family toxin [Clostridium sp.]|nr:type II toxin-antitoxin system RelE/ParE family toxin [Clostridium sp.]MCM1547258.1 type II toxin-antitoxin system RelE/ParE family toxin [Ruminococcus sp.]
MYKIIIKKKAKKFIDKLPKNERLRIAKAIEMLPNGEDIKRLKGSDDLLRLRVGDYRIIYTIDHGELIVIVVDAGNRGQIYK